MGAESLLNTSYFRYTNGQKTIDCKEVQALEGYIYGVANAVDDVANSGSIYIQFNTPDDRDVIVTNIIVKLQNVTGASGTLIILEAPTYTTGTTALTPINYNRQSSNTSGATVFSDPTTISGGTTIYIDRAFGDRGATSETVFPAKLKRDTAYIANFTNNSGSAADMLLRVVFNECNFDA